MAPVRILALLALLGIAQGCGNEKRGGGGREDDDDNDSAGAGPGSGEDAGLCVDIINQHRASIGLPPYARWTEAEACSSEAAAKDARSGEAHGAFGDCGESAQNECPGWPGPPSSMIAGCLQMMWDEGPGEDFGEHGHYLNMSSTSYSRVACGFHVLESGEVWSVQNFR